MQPHQRLIADDGYEVALYPMTSAKITQSYAGATSHRCTTIYNTGLWDVVGQTGETYQSEIYAPFSGTVVVQKSSGNQRVIASDTRVHMADGSFDYANFGWGHDNQLLVNLGDHVTQGQLIGYTGTKDATGRHSHLMLGTGQWTRGNNLPTCYSSGASGNIYYMPNPKDIDDMFYVNNTNVVTYSIDGLTLHWRTYQGGQPQPTDKYRVTLSVDPSDGGYCTGAGEYEEGTEVWIECHPASGYKFKRWSDGYTGNPRYVIMDMNYSYVAYLERIPSKTKFIMLNHDGTDIFIH